MQPPQVRPLREMDNNVRDTTVSIGCNLGYFVIIYANRSRFFERKKRL